MNVRITHQLPPTPNNPRNSEGAFLRGKKGEILFAYSRYTGESNHDHASCDIALITSFDEGETWSEPRIIAPASFFGVANVMSVSALEQQNGDLAFYFLIKENDFTSTLGRTVSTDGEHFTCQRCQCDFKPGYYVVNNDRFVRQKNGRILVPAAYYSAEHNKSHTTTKVIYPSCATLFYSDDDGASFQGVNWIHEFGRQGYQDHGLEEPGIIEREDGSLFYWMRTNYGCQFESVSDGDIQSFTAPRPGHFSSPRSPMQIKEYDGVTYAIYNPIPSYNERPVLPGTWGRTPFVLRKGTATRIFAKDFGPLNIIEDDESRGYCYPALFKTEDGHLLLAYCRGDEVDGNTLCRLGITKVEIDSIQ